MESVTLLELSNLLGLANSLGALIKDGGRVGAPMSTSREETGADEPGIELYALRATAFPNARLGIRPDVNRRRVPTSRTPTVPAGIRGRVKPTRLAERLGANLRLAGSHGTSARTRIIVFLRRRRVGGPNGETRAWTRI